MFQFYFRLKTTHLIPNCEIISQLIRNTIANTFDSELLIICFENKELLESAEKCLSELFSLPDLNCEFLHERLIFMLSDVVNEGEEREENNEECRRIYNTFCNLVPISITTLNSVAITNNLIENMGGGKVQKDEAKNKVIERRKTLTTTASSLNILSLKHPKK